MKTITFLRHSKSSWGYDVSDVNRPLNEFGIKKIKKLSNLSINTFNQVEIFFSSPANRAIHTCIILANSLEIDLKKISIRKELYTFDMNEVFDFIKQINDKYSNIVLVGHNPAYTEISNYFSENKILNLPTARWFCLKFDTDSWSKTIGIKPIHYSNNIYSES
tara:strand:- start:1447 stop:1935 length:489 start_codon:yes stop_codon:yes gene_type:complete